MHCTRCGALLPLNATMCPSCGLSLAVPMGEPRAAGKTISPGVVLLLTLVTLGIYQLFYWWGRSKEVDGFTGRPGHAHGKVRLGVFLGVGAGALLVVGWFFIFGAIASAATSGAAGSPGVGGAVGFGAASVLIFLAAAGIGIAAAIMLYMGYWRVWRAIEDDERARGEPKVLSPGLMLAFFLIPYVNLVTVWFALHRTQKGLNGMWARAAAMPAPAF